MTQKESAAAPTGSDEVEREFWENLRAAAYIFEKKENGRFNGSIMTCRAVARFIYRRNGAPTLAVPFLNTALAFAEREKGGNPRLFSKKTEPDKERERSPERKHIQRLAAAFLEVLVKLGETREAAAARIARHVNNWPGMGAQDVRGETIVAWWKQYRGRSDRHFLVIVEEILSDPNPLGVVEGVLDKGPPGLSALAAMTHGPEQVAAHADFVRPASVPVRSILR
jgi:hypothetical protein